MTRLFLLVVIAAATCVIAACSGARPPAPTAPPTPISPADPSPSPGGTDHSLGQPDAPTLLEEYGDLQ